MVSNRTIQIRITKTQYDRIQQDAAAKGFRSPSSYLRYVALDHDFIIHQKIGEIHTYLLGATPVGKGKKNHAVACQE